LALHPTLVGFAAFPVSWSYTQSMEHSDGGSAHHKASTYTQDNTNRINAYRHSCLKWDLNPWPQHSSRRRQFMPQTKRPQRSVNFRNLYSLNVTPDFTPMKNNGYNCNKDKHSDLIGTKQSVISFLIWFLSVQLCYIFKGFVICLYTMVLSWILVTRHEHIQGKFASVLN
jgi:hypothetical protein